MPACLPGLGGDWDWTGRQGGREETYADADKELVEVDAAISVGVEEGHQGVSLLAADSDLDLAQARVELVAVDLVVAVEGVEVSESPAETANRLRASGLDLSPDALQNCTQTRR